MIGYPREQRRIHGREPLSGILTWAAAEQWTPGLGQHRVGFDSGANHELRMLPGIERQLHGARRRPSEKAVQVHLAAGYDGFRRSLVDQVRRLMALGFDQRLDHGPAYAGLAQYVANVACKDGFRADLDEQSQTFLHKGLERRFELHGLAHVQPPMIRSQRLWLGKVSRNRGDEALSKRQRLQSFQLMQQRYANRLDQCAVEGIVEVEPSRADAQIGRGCQYANDLLRRA